MWEESGKWPVALERALVSLVPKGQGCRPQDLRPISVMSAIYRLWAARRLLDLKRWQELWVTDGQHAFRARHSTEDIFWTLALQIEDSVLHGKPLFGINFDYTKCFDLVPHSILLPLIGTMECLTGS
eukprot:447503-Karenia_brevis.AAC.1